MTRCSPPPSSAQQAALRLLTTGSGVKEAVRRAQQSLDDLTPWLPPARDAALLITTLAAAAPHALSPAIGQALAATIHRGDLSQTWQPGLDEAFALLPLLIATPAAEVLPGLLSEVLTVEDLHERWARRAIALLTEIARWRPALLDIDAILAISKRCPRSMRPELFNEVVTPLLLANPASVTRDRLRRAWAIPHEPIEGRYLTAALSGHPQTPPEAASVASDMMTGWFPLRAAWQRVFGQRGLRVLCVQNIADAQGDEIVRTVPLLQALLDSHPETRVTLITDRSYLYGHERLRPIGFDDRLEIEQELAGSPDVLIEFFESDVRHLNHDPGLSDLIAVMRERVRPPLDIHARKSWNHFTLDSVWFGGLDWSRALLLDRLQSNSVYDPAFRLIIELGLPLRIGRQQPQSGSVLAGGPEPAAEAAWDDLTQRNGDGRPVALVNPFGGAGPLKGFVPRKYDDLAALLGSLVDEGYFVILCPTGSQWGSLQAAREIRSRLSTEWQAWVAIAPDPAARQGEVLIDERATRTIPYASAIMRQYIRYVASADLIVTVEGWMAHAAYVLGRPYRVLMLTEQHGIVWQAWGRSSDQQIWLFSGDPALDLPPLPEQPRKYAWLRLLGQVIDPDWLGTLEEATRSEDYEIRRAAAQGLGRLGSEEAVPHLTTLLADRSHLVRGAAAEALLAHQRARLGENNLPDAATLDIVRSIASPSPDWRAIVRRGSIAEEPLRAALTVDDPVIRREAAAALERLSRNRLVEESDDEPWIALTHGDPGASPTRARAGEGDTKMGDGLLFSRRLPSLFRGRVCSRR